MKRLLAVSIAAIVASTACSGSDDAAPIVSDDEPVVGSADSIVDEGDEVVPVSLAPGDQTQSTDAPDEAAIPVSEPEPEPEPEPSFFGNFPIVIRQITDESGNGVRPLLEWEPVPGADHYGVYVYAPSGATYWAWRGAETSVYVGGATQIREDAAGPSVAENMNWAVVAYDKDLLPLAASPLRPIAP